MSMKSSSNREHELRDLVVERARVFIAETENPAPDLLHRARLRDQLANAVHELEAEIRRA